MKQFPSANLYTTKILNITISFLFIFSMIATSSAAYKMGEAKGTTTRWGFFPAINGGYNHLVAGYDGYKDLGNLGLDLYIQPPNNDSYLVDLHEHFLMRISADWFPLQVPKGTSGLTEDIYSLNTSFIYKFNFPNGGGFELWNPFLGVGLGIYQDRIKLETNASGTSTGHDNHFGTVFSGGIIIPVASKRFPVRIIPEIRYHRIQFISNYSDSITYQLGLAYWPSGEK